jgi:N-acetyl-anhydromuramyl-L-alanine amidase AmpD
MTTFSAQDGTYMRIEGGTVVDPKVTNKINQKIEKGAMATVNGIVVHQTGGSSAQSAFSAYSAGAAGAHFLIDKDGTIYQTARTTQKTWHVGKLQTRCVAEHKCKPPATWNPSATHKAESSKTWPDRYPSNEDSIGIELVGKFDATAKTYETVTKEQNESLKWLVRELSRALSLLATEVFRHPQVSYKEPSEASSADWK